MPTVKKVWGVVSTVLVIAVVLAAIFLMGSRVVGFRIFNVVSGSMEPAYSIGDLIYVKEVDPSTIVPGSVASTNAISLSARLSKMWYLPCFVFGWFSSGGGHG